MWLMPIELRDHFKLSFVDFVLLVLELASWSDPSGGGSSSQGGRRLGRMEELGGGNGSVTMLLLPDSATRFTRP